MKPFFSIITATYNAASVLPRLLESLAAQTCRDFELVVQDGASSDDTVSIVDHYRAKLPSLSVCSEPDKGIYDAWNRALLRVQGEWVIFLGADDEMAGSNILEKCHYVMRELSDTSMHAGGHVECVDHNGNIVSQMDYALHNIDEKIILGMPFPYPGIWHRSSLFSLNNFDLSMRIAGDYDFICRTWTKENGNTVLPFVVTRMHRGGISDSPQNVLRARWENAIVASRYFSGVWTRDRIVELGKGVILFFLCKIFGPAKAARFHDYLKKKRKLPPVWTGF